MNEIFIDKIRSLFSELVTACFDMNNIARTTLDIYSLNIVENRIREILNKIFDNFECISVITTNNTDKVLFGINVNPTITDTDLMNILFETDKQVELKRYSIEIDLSICNKLSDLEIASYIMEEVFSNMNSDTLENVRAVIDILLADEDESIDIRQSVNFSQILIFGIKDTIKQISSLLYKPVENLGNNEYVFSAETKDYLINAASKLKSCIFADTNVNNCPKLGILKWSLMVYKDIKTNYRMMDDILNQALQLTGSVLDKKEIEKTIKCFKRALSEVVVEGANTLEAMNEAKGFSLFKSLKQNGLRSIEDDLYEFKIRLKNAETEEDAIYILRQINTRISILEDYIANTELSDNEERHWQSVIDSYRSLRIELSKKKIGYKKTYGVFVDYDKFDAIEN